MAKSDKVDNVFITEETIAAQKQQYELIRKLQKEYLIDTVDYGYPPDSTQKKPSLFKSGAEKLMKLGGLRQLVELIGFIEQPSLVLYRCKAQVIDASGNVVSEGLGMATSDEKEKWKATPMKFANTILKMARKRAFVDAILTAFGASEIFTQDIEDYDAEQLNDNNGPIVIHPKPTQVKPTVTQQQVQQTQQQAPQQTQQAQQTQQPERTTDKLEIKRRYIKKLLREKIPEQAQVLYDELAKMYNLEDFASLNECIGFIQKLTKEQLEKFIPKRVDGKVISVEELLSSALAAEKASLNDSDDNGEPPF